MRRTAAALLALLVAAGCSAGSAVRDYGTVVKGREGVTSQVQLAQGQRFTLAVPSDAAGDDWELAGVPDAKVASFISEEHQSDQNMTYFVFNAKSPGNAEIRLRVTAPSDGEAVFAVTVS
jgi:inhibitor of cysteine peptidase